MTKKHSILKNLLMRLKSHQWSVLRLPWLVSPPTSTSPYLKILAITFSCLFAFAQAHAQTYAQYVNPMIGSQGQGHIFVGPSVPFGMVKPGPDCGDGGSNSGYKPGIDEPVIGFSQVHVSGTGGGAKYGNIQLMPFTGEVDNIDQKSLRQSENAKLGYYSAVLKSGIKAELSTTHSVAFHQYVYPHASRKAVKIDAGFFLGEKPVPDAREAQQFVGSEIEIVNDKEVRGYSRIRGGWNNGAAYTVYFYAIFNAPFTNFSTWKGKVLHPGTKVQPDSGDKTGALLSFQNVPGDTLKVKIGISFLSSLKAQQNIAAEVPGWSFNDVLQQCREGWESYLNRIEIDAGTSLEQKTMFYTALYHTMLMPVNRTGENPLWTNKPYYDDFYAIWDTYRTSHPLLTLISPARQTEIVNALLNIYRYDGYLPDARSGNFNGRTQGGSNAEVLIADAYVKGLKGIDYELALAAMLKDANVPPGGNEEKEGRGGLTDYNRLGYVSSDFVRAGNRTVDYAFNDYCIAIVAKGLGHLDVYKRFIKQSENWKNLWRDGYADHGAIGFILPKDAKGNWIDSIAYVAPEGNIAHYQFTPLSNHYPKYACWWCGFFYEGSSWEYSLSIPHDVPGLIDKAGGKDAFVKRLDTLFDNGYYVVANEPSFLTPCLYHWAGRPDLSGQRIKSIVEKNYSAKSDGLPGNDDSGAMSSWLIFHMMGFYPNAGHPYYLLHSPLLKHAVLHQENGRDFKIIAKNLSDKNSYIKSATLNGKPFLQSWISHDAIVAGGELIFEMDSRPSAWGTNQPMPVNE